MNMTKSEVLNAHIKKSRIRKIVIILISVIAAVGVYYFATNKEDNAKKNAINFLDVGVEKASKENLYVYLDVAYEGYYFADYTDGSYIEKYYMLWDSNGYPYIALLDDETAESLAKLEDSEEDKTIRIYGKTKSIVDELNKIATEEIAEIYEDDEVTTDNVYRYIGDVYIDVTYSEVSFLWYISIVLFAIIAAVTIICGIVFEIQIRKTNKKYDEEIWEKIASELDDNIDPFSLKFAKFTNNYIIRFVGGIDVLEYKDIVWMYFYELRHNGVLTHKELRLHTIDKKIHAIATHVSLSRKLNIDQELVDYLDSKNDNILYGVKKEVKAQAKEIFKEYKEQRKSNEK